MDGWTDGRTNVSYKDPEESFFIPEISWESVNVTELKARGTHAHKHKGEANRPKTKQVRLDTTVRSYA